MVEVEVKEVGDCLPVAPDLGLFFLFSLLSLLFGFFQRCEKRRKEIGGRFKTVSISDRFLLGRRDWF